MEEQQVQAAVATSSFKNRFAPAWERQQVFVAIPTKEDCSGKEWRLFSRVVSIGELMIALGGEYSAHDIDLFWQSMTIAAEKRQVNEHQNKKRTAAH